MQYSFRLLATATAFSASLSAQVPVGQSSPPATWVNYGLALTPAGDIDGDGVSDLAAAAQIQTGTPGGNGVGLRMLSGLDLHVLRTQEELPTAQMNNYRPPHLAGGHDINADHVPDLLLAVDGPYGLGRVDVLSGLDGSVLHQATPLALGFNDVAAADFVGDINGDGIFDYVAGFSHGVGSNIGKLVWFSGASGGVLQSVAVDPAALNDYGASMHLIGDLNGDGAAEICLAFTGVNTFSGRAWIHDGRSGALLHTIDGAQIYGALGGFATDLGDIDGDGHPDFALSAWSGIDAGTPAHVRAYSGASFALLWDHQEAVPYLAFGVSLSNTGDLNGDGVADLAVGANSGSILSPPVGAGRIWLLSGADGATISQLSGSPLGDFFGASTASLDLDGDGRHELVIASPDFYQQATAGGRIESFSTCPLPPQRMCTANQTPNGCQPTLLVYGSTQWNAPVHITLIGNDLPRFQPSLLLIGREASQIPFGGGSTLCLAPPLRRTLPQNTGGNPQGSVCSGQTSRVLDQTRLTALGFGPGDSITLQSWIANPPTTRGALSDALRLVLCP